MGADDQEDGPRASRDRDGFTPATMARMMGGVSDTLHQLNAGAKIQLEREGLIHNRLVIAQDKIADKNEEIGRLHLDIAALKQQDAEIRAAEVKAQTEQARAAAMASMVGELMATVKVLGHDWLKSRDPVRRYREEDISYAEALFLSIGATLKKVSESPQATEWFKQSAALEMAELVEVLKAYKAHRDQTTSVDGKKAEDS